MQQNHDTLDLEVIQTLASRIGRKCFLEHFCEASHPVLMTELELVEMARSKMIEQFIIHPQNDWPMLQKAMTKIARHWISSHINDHEISNRILCKIKEDIAEIMPKIH